MVVVLMAKELYFPLIYPKDFVKSFHFFYVFSKTILNKPFLKHKEKQLCYFWISLSKY